MILIRSTCYSLINFFFDKYSFLVIKVIIFLVYLMQNGLNHLKYPIDLLSIPKKYLFNFYTSLGFVFIKENRLPEELKKHLNSIIRLFPMVLEEK